MEESWRRAKVLNNERAQADINYYLGWIFYALGEQDQSMQYSKRALSQATALKADKLASQLRANIGQSAAASGRYEQAKVFLNDAITEIGRNQGTTVPIERAYGMSCKAFVVADEGDFDYAEELMRDALDSVRKPPQAIEASILNMQSAIFLWQGRWGDAVRNAVQVQRICERFSLPFLSAVSRSVESFGRFSGEQDDGMLDVLRGATQWLEETELRLYYSLNYGWMAEVLAHSSHAAEVPKYAERAIELAERGDRLGAAMAYRALAHVAVVHPNVVSETPDHYFQLAYASGESRNSPHEIAVTQLHDARYCLRQRNFDRASGLLEQAKSAFLGLNMEWHLGEASRLSDRLASLR